MDESVSTGTASTPAPSAPSDTGVSAPSAPVTADRPTSMQDSLQRAFAEESAPSTPETPEPAPTTPEPAITAPVAEQSETPVTDIAPTEAAGPIPFERHKAALDNARTKTREEVTAQLEQQYAPIRQFAAEFQRDPVDAWMKLGQELQTDPRFSPQLTSYAARTLAAQRGQSQQPSGQMPEADLQTPDGTRLYSAEQQAKREEWLIQKVLTQVKGEMAPLQQAHQQQQAAQAQQQHRAQTEQSVKTRLSAWEKQPYFKEHAADIGKAQKAFVEQGLDSWTALGLAYSQVMSTKVQPHLQAQTQQTLVQKAVTKAAASTGNPAAVAPAPPRKPRSMRESLEQAFSNAG